MLIEAIALSLGFSFFLFELTGLTAGGLIAPGYYAMSFDQPLIIGMSLAIALASFVCVRTLSFFSILYGRRRFILCILIGFSIQWYFTPLVIGLEIGMVNHEIVGYIIPGLVANEMDKQGVGNTLLALLCCSCIVFLFLHFK